MSLVVLFLEPQLNFQWSLEYFLNFLLSQEVQLNKNSFLNIEDNHIKLSQEDRVLASLKTRNELCLEGLALESKFKVHEALVACTEELLLIAIFEDQFHEIKSKKVLLRLSEISYSISLRSSHKRLGHFKTPVYNSSFHLGDRISILIQGILIHFIRVRVERFTIGMMI